MRLITWNCQGAYRKKYQHILALKPDIVVIQECEHPDKISFADASRPTDALWFGDNRNKGLGVFTYNRYRLREGTPQHADVRLVVHVEVLLLGHLTNLFAVYANKTVGKRKSYIRQVFEAIDHYGELLRRPRTILAGDFNSNTIWDRRYRVGNHSHVVERFEEMGIHSVYHHMRSEEQGKETEPTFYLQRNRAKAYHIDYCFASNDLLAKVSRFSVGSHDDWIGVSDHAPLLIDFD